MSTKLIDLRESMRFGMGVDSLTEQVRGEALVFDGTTTNQGGQKVKASVQMIQSQESLMEALDISVNASVRYGLASVDAKMDFARRHAVNQYSVYMLFKADVRNPPKFMTNARLTDRAMEVYQRDPEEFRRAFGDSYIDEIYSGGEFFGLFIFRTRDESTRTEVSAKLDVSVGSFLAGGSISASFKNTVEEVSRRAQMDIQVIMSGGSGLLNATNLDELSALYRNFNASVRDHGVDYKAAIKEFQYLPLPAGPSWVEQLIRRDTIEECGRRVINAIQLRSKIDYILQNPGQFVEPDEEALRRAQSQLNALIPKWGQQALACSNDVSQCSLEGLDPVNVPLPQRMAIADPIDAKWEDIKAYDSRAAGYFLEKFLSPTNPISKYDRGPRGGRYKIFYNNGVPMGGIFWHPQVDNGNAHVVYGGIFQEYLRRGHCEGPLGYPTTDEQTYTPFRPGKQPDGLDRVSYFENGLLWWDAQTGRISDEDIGVLSQVIRQDNIFGRIR
jgi:hypothetical protein